MWRTVRIVWKKELIDHLRDRRTAAMIFLLSVAMGPLMLVGLTYFISNIEEKAEKKEFFMLGQEYAPQLVNFLQRQDVRLKVPAGDFRDLIKSGKHDPVLVIPKDFTQKFLEGRAEVEMIYDDTRSDGGNVAIGAMRRQLFSFNAEVAGQRMIARGVSPQLLRAIDINETNLGTIAQKAAMLLFIIPMMALVVGVTGCTAVAIDMTAGERERGSLEPLLMNPVTREALVLGKWLAVTCYGLAVVGLILLGFFLTLTFAPMPKLAALVSLSPAQYAGFALTLASFAPAIGSLQMLIAIYGRTFKEAQTYVSYLVMLVAMVPSITMFAQLKDATWQLFVPMLAQQMVMTRILRGETVGVLHFALPLAINLAIMGVAVALISQLLKKERIIFARS
ncbi:MAG: ABC transporter permease [Betaproteobacteria bacterium]|nr:ABC transporter permease [Betaproteobacteria bacterium]